MASPASPAETRDKRALKGSDTGPDASHLKPFSITHIRRSQPAHVLIDVIRAKDETDAAKRADEHFPDSTVLRICRARASEDAHLAQAKNRVAHAQAGKPADQPATDHGDPPNARFIRGRFRFAGSEDEPVLRTICE